MKKLLALLLLLSILSPCIGATKAKQCESAIAGFYHSGDVVSGGKVYFYNTDGTSPTTSRVWEDADKSVDSANPVTLDSNGRATDIYLDGEYKMVVADSDDVVLFTVDDASYSTVVDFGGLYIDIESDYGRTASLIQNAIDAYPSDNRTFLFQPYTYTIGTSISFPTNISVKMAKGALFSISSGKTVSINGYLDAGNYPIMTGAGDLVVSQTYNPQQLAVWENGATDETTWYGDQTISGTLTVATLNNSSTTTTTADFKVGRDLYVSRNEIVSGNSTIVGTLSTTGLTTLVTANITNAIITNIDISSKMDVTTTTNAGNNAISVYQNGTGRAGYFYRDINDTVRPLVSVIDESSTSSYAALEVISLSASNNALEVSGNVEISGYSDLGDTGLEIKIVTMNIVTWNMNANRTYNLAHGLASKDRIVSVLDCMVRNDANNKLYSVFEVVGSDNEADDRKTNGLAYIDDTYIYLEISTTVAKTFTGSDWDSATINRGYVVLITKE